jgi:nucleotide-binding universal stress UspA family protein
VPLTRSEYSQRILPQIEKLISAQDCKLFLFYVTKPQKGIGFAAPDFWSDYALEVGGEPLGPQTHPVYTSQQEDSLLADVEVALLPVANHLKRRGYEVALQICLGGDTIDEIMRTMEREKIDLVAMSTRVREGVQRFFFSDIAERVLQRVNIPVLLIQPQV